MQPAFTYYAIEVRHVVMFVFSIVGRFETNLNKNLLGELGFKLKLLYPINKGKDETCLVMYIDLFLPCVNLDLSCCRITQDVLKHFKINISDRNTTFRQLHVVIINCKYAKFDSITCKYAKIDSGIYTNI